MFRVIPNFFKNPIYTDMKNIEIYESFTDPGRKYFTEEEIKTYQRMWDFLHQKYRFNQFFSRLWDQAKSKKYLSKKQWAELEFLLKNGKSQYEAEKIPNNY